MAMVSKSRTSRRAISAFGMALVASLALSVVGVASASAATQYWYGEKGKLSEGKPSGFTMAGSSTFVMYWIAPAGTHPVTCTVQKSEGTVENPVGGAAGTAKASSFVLSNCTMTTLPGCKVKEGKIEMVPLKAVTTEATSGLKTYPAVEFSPQEGTLLFYLTLTSCSQSGYNISWPFYGSFIAISKTGFALEFLKQGTMHWSAGPAQLTGTSKLLTTGGEGLYIAP